MRERTDTVIPASLRGRRRLMMRLAAFIVAPAMAFAISRIEIVGLPSWLAAWNAKCDIKGNISTTTGERIYHLPGGRYYAATTISLMKGERWFCSQAQARAAGWRKSRR
jgi:hypothetical protein